MVLDAWAGSGPMPCALPTDAVLARWAEDHVDSGIWWVRDRTELRSVICWIKTQKGKFILATRAGDAPRLHTAGRRSLYIGMLNSRTEDLATAYRLGVRFARAPAEQSEQWLAESRRLGIAADVGPVHPRTTSALLAVDGPSFLYGWARATDRAPPGEIIRKLAARGGVLLMLGAPDKGVGYEDMRYCLLYVRWDHCGIAGAADPQALSTTLFGSGLSEGNVARMFGFNVLRVLRKAELWSEQR